MSNTDATADPTAHTATITLTFDNSGEMTLASSDLTDMSYSMILGALATAGRVFIDQTAPEENRDTVIEKYLEYFHSSSEDVVSTGTI